MYCCGTDVMLHDVMSNMHTVSQKLFIFLFF